jgi:hypothetical protein
MACSAPDYRLLEYGSEMTIRSNADREGVDFFQQIIETMRRPPASSRLH